MLSNIFLNNKKTKFYNYEKIILTMLLSLSFITHVYSQKAYDELYISNEELQSLKEELN